MINDTTSIADKIRPVKFPTEFPTNNKQQSTIENFKNKFMEAAEAMEREKEDTLKMALAAAKEPDPNNPDDKTSQQAMHLSIDIGAKCNQHQSPRSYDDGATPRSSKPNYGAL